MQSRPRSIMEPPASVWKEYTCVSCDHACQIGFILALALSMEMATDGDGILSSHNGVLMKFFKSLHAINHYWYRTVFISKSVLGCLVLKFIGSSLVSLSHGKAPSWIDHPSYIISFLIAFCLSAPTRSRLESFRGTCDMPHPRRSLSIWPQLSTR